MVIYHTPGTAPSTWYGFTYVIFTNLEMTTVAILFFKPETRAQSYLLQGCKVMQKGPRSSL